MDASWSAIFEVMVDYCCKDGLAKDKEDYQADPPVLGWGRTVGWLRWEMMRTRLGSLMDPVPPTLHGGGVNILDCEHPQNPFGYPFFRFGCHFGAAGNHGFLI